MALESATYISDLNSSNPTAGDPVAQGDDHTRLLKSTIKATFPNVAGAVTPTHTELNYVDGVTSAIQTQLTQATLTAATAQATTSGTAINFTSIPSWVKRIDIAFSAVSTNGTSMPMIQIGDAGGIEATGYVGTTAQVATTPSVSVSAHSTGFHLNGAHVAAATYYGTATLTLLDSATNTWSFSVNTGRGESPTTSGFGGGSKALSATLDRIRLTTVGGSDAFDAGSINIQYH